MKTYKLIKTYPGSFPLGHLAILDESVKYYNLGTTTRSLDYIENHPENWQHVCYKCHENVNTCKTFGCKQPIFITEDGKEFFDDSSIVYYVNILNFGILSTIISSIKPNMQSYVLNNKFFGCISAANKYAEENKPKVKLFTTEDGVDIFAGNTYVMVTNDLFESRTLVAMGNEINNIKRFSTKKAAENYIKMNKPCLSLNDVLSITNKTSFVPEDFSKNLIKKELTKIVKQKLK